MLAWTQAVYFVTTGLWPLIDIESFQAVTGPKTDLWLVRLFGVMICVPALILADGARRRQSHAGVVIAGMASAVVLLVGDVVCVATGAVGPIYLGDAVLELILAGGWGYCLIRPGARGTDGTRNATGAHGRPSFED